MVIDYTLIGRRIKERRLEKNLTQENIAEHLDISVSYVSRVERAAVKISLETLVRVAIFLDVSPAFLLDGTIAVSRDYLQGELADVVNGFNSGQMCLLMDIAQAVKKNGLTDN
jgi:transcriptional regulator with XRE-family HTH domain